MYFFVYEVILNKDTGLYLDYPKFTLWYLLALFAWRLITPYFKKIPHYMIVAVVAGLFIGCSSIKANYLSIGRIVYFYPFFLAGTNFQRETITKLRERISQRTAAIASIILFSCVLIFPVCFDYSSKIFYGRYHYDTLGQGDAEGLLCRLACYAISFALTYLLLILITEKQTFYSYIGTRTMAVYLFHGLLCASIKHLSGILKHVNTASESLVLLAFCVLMTVIFSMPAFTRFTNAVTNIGLPKGTPYSPENRTLFSVR